MSARLCRDCSRPVRTYLVQRRGRTRPEAVYHCPVCLPARRREERAAKRGPARQLSGHWFAQWGREGRAELADDYVRALLSRGTRVRPGDWPEWLVELKRQHLALRRRALA